MIEGTSTLTRPSWKRISTVSLRMGSSPEWWIPHAVVQKNNY